MFKLEYYLVIGVVGLAISLIAFVGMQLYGIRAERIQRAIINQHRSGAFDTKPGPNVIEFGAKGDGVHDDTEAFMAAIKAANPSEGIVIPFGRYRVQGWEDDLYVQDRDYHAR